MEAQISIDTTYQRLERSVADLIGRRILCVLKPRNLSGSCLESLPSPTQVSSEFWSPEALQLGKQSHDNDLNKLAWCPKHHHHQNSQKDAIDRLKWKHQESKKKPVASSLAGKASYQFAGSNKRARQKQPQQLQQQQAGFLQTTIPGGTNFASSPIPITSPKIEAQNCDSDVQKGQSIDAHYCELCDKTTPANLGNDDNSRKLKILRNLPWRLGIIRAVCDGKSVAGDVADLLIEFDLLEWKAREWFHVSRRRLVTAPEDATNGNIAGNDNTCSPQQATDESFTELLIENAVGCCKRQNSPAGIDKLWPARIYRVLIDELDFFKPDHKAVAAVEYFDPVAMFASNEPNCLNGQLVETELLASLPESVVDSLKANNQRLGTLETQPKSTATTTTSNDCDKCQSPIVEFVSTLDILRPSQDRDACAIRKTLFRRFLEFIGSILTSEKTGEDDYVKSSQSVQQRDGSDDENKIVKQRHNQYTCWDLVKTFVAYPRVYSSLRSWHLFQDAQALFASATMAPSLVGHRVKVYKFPSTTQWYTAVIMGYEPKSGRLRLIDDTVLEQHYEAPSQTEMHLIDAEIVQSIIEGTSNSGRSSGQAGASRRRVPRAASQQQSQAGQAKLARSSSNSQQQASGASKASVASSSFNNPAGGAGQTAASTSSSSSSWASSSLVSIYGPELAMHQATGGKRSLAAGGRGSLLLASSQSATAGCTGADHQQQQLSRSDSVGLSSALALVGPDADGLISKLGAKTTAADARGSKVATAANQVAASVGGGGGSGGSRSFRSKSPTQINLSPFGDLFAWNCLDESPADSDRSLELQGATLDGRNLISHRLRLQDLCQQAISSSSGSSNSEPSCSSSSQITAFDRVTTPDESPPTSSTSTATGLAERRQPTFEFASLRGESKKRKLPAELDTVDLAKEMVSERQDQALSNCHLGKLISTDLTDRDMQQYK